MGPTHPHRSTALLVGSIWLVVLLLLWVPAPSLLAQIPGGEPVDTYEKALRYSLAISEFEARIPETGKLRAVTVGSLQASLASEAAEVSIPSEQLSDFMVYASKVMSNRTRMRCNISPAATGLRPFSGDKPVKTRVMDFIEARNLVFLGEIERVAPAWSFDRNTAIAIVFLRIEEVLKDEGNDFSAGSLVTYVRPWGEVTILGTPFCTDPPPDAPSDGSPHVGQRVLLTGSKDLRNPDHLVTHHSGIFPVVDGVVFPPAGDPRFLSGTVSLADVPESLF